MCREGREGLTLSAEIVRREVIGGVVVEIVDEPSMAQRAVGYIRHSELFGSFDQTVCFVDCLEG